MPLATLGVFILWLGWFGFNGASQLAMGTISDVSAVAKIFVNTNMAACAGVITAVVYTQLRYKNLDVTMALNGALGGWWRLPPNLSRQASLLPCWSEALVLCWPC
jgi:Amt family ammonium transporter